MFSPNQTNSRQRGQTEKKTLKGLKPRFYNDRGYDRMI